MVAFEDKEPTDQNDVEYRETETEHDGREEEIPVEERTGGGGSDAVDTDLKYVLEIKTGGER